MTFRWFIYAGRVVGGSVHGNRQGLFMAMTSRMFIYIIILFVSIFFIYFALVLSFDI